jgi:hypothetical protein
MKIAIGHSDEVLAADAAEEAVERCRAALDGERPRAALLFASVEYEHETALARIAAEWPGLPLVGGSSDGELSSELGFRHDSFLLTLIAGDVRVHAGLGRDLSRDVASAVRSATAGLVDAGCALCLTTFAPTANASAVVRALNEHVGGGRVVGGLTGDHREFLRTREFFGDQVLRDALPALFLSGDFHCSSGVGSGWFPIGDVLRVTRSEGHIVHEIDGQPALSTYEQHYGSVPDHSLGEYPLALYPEGADRPWSLRAILDSDRRRGSLRFAGEVPEGSPVRMTEVLPDGLLAGSQGSLSAALAAYAGDDPELALIFSCAARKWVLGTQAAREIERLQACVREHGPAGLPIAGLYCYGEIAPPDGAQRSAFHNETCVSLVLGR